MYIGRPAPPETLIDREKTINILTKSLSNMKINPLYALIGYRRIGKTSILLNVKQKLESKGLIVIYYDVKERLSDPDSFLMGLQEEIFNEYGKHLSLGQKISLKATAIKKILLRKLPDIVTSIDEIGVEISPDGSITPRMRFQKRGSPNYSAVFKSVFKTMDIISEKSKKRVVIILDEFQDILKLKSYRGLSNVLDLYRAALQRRGNVCHIISGSNVHMIRTLLEDHSSPIFQHFILEYVGELKTKDATKLFSTIIKNRNLKLKAKSIKTAAEEAVKYVGGHPYYIMILAHTWDGKRKIVDILDDMMYPPAGQIYLYANYVLATDLAKAKGGPLLKKVTQTIALSDGPIEASEIAREIGKSQNYLEFYIKQLIEYDIIKKVERGKYQLVDKVISLCINKNYSTN